MAAPRRSTNGYGLEYDHVLRTRHAPLLVCWCCILVFAVGDAAQAGAAAPARGAELRLKETPKPNYGVPVPEKVAGRVVLDADGDGTGDPGEAGVAGVSVSDGYSVVKTDAQGAYALKTSPCAVFVFITRPSGHDVTGSWYKPLAATVGFSVRRCRQDESQYTFVHVTDSHTSTDARSTRGLRRFVEEVNALAPPARFVFNSGDLVNLDKQLKVSPARGHQFFRNYTGIMNHLTMPHYNVAGDHTDSSHRLADFPRGDHRAGKAMFWEYLGPNLFSFEYGRLHFISVDVVYHLGPRTSHRMVPEHLAWLKQDLACRTPGTIVLTASENPLEKSVPGFVDLAKQHDVRLQLVGDTHIVSFKAEAVQSRAGGALSGTWWNGPCSDLHPQGYLIYQARGTALECFYKGLGERVAVVSPAYGAAVKGEVRLRAHLVQPQPGEALHYRVGRTGWKPMSEVGRPFYRALCEARWDSTSADDGLVEFEVKTVPGGEVRSRLFVVSNGKAHGSYDDEDATLAFAVGKVTTARRPPSGKVDVLLNGTPVGVLLPGRRQGYSFRVPGRILRKVNALTFRFGRPTDGMSITRPLVTFRGKAIEDPRAAAVTSVRVAHWKKGVADWSGFVVGGERYEDSFALRQQVFHFVLPGRD